MTDIGRGASLVFLLFFACCLFYFCLTFVVCLSILSLLPRPLVFLYIFLDFLPLGKNASMQREENIFLFFFPAPRQGSHMHWLRAIFGTSFELNLPSSPRFWQILVHFLFLKHRNIFKSRWLFAFPIPVDKEGHLKICVVSVDIVPPPPPPYLWTLQIL